MKVGQICLSSGPAASSFAELVESLDRLAIRQHVLVADPAIGRRLQCCPHVTVGPVVHSPVMAYCLMPDVDIVHVHDYRAGQAGLLLTLTRSIPFVANSDCVPAQRRGGIAKAVRRRARMVFSPEGVEIAMLPDVYRRSVIPSSEFPQESDGG